jgi:hypothetical protein
VGSRLGRLRLAGAFRCETNIHRARTCCVPHGCLRDHPLVWRPGAQAPVRGRSQLSPTGAFNPAAASPAPAAEELDRLIESSTAVNGKLSRDDIRVLPLLRSAAVVKGLRFPRKVRDYFETMMELVGYQPLPAV